METQNKILNWPYELFDIECGKGWKDLYQPLIDYIEEYNAKHKPDSYFEIHQIKEKFAGLRFYWDGYNIPGDIAQEFQNRVEEAESKSYQICEQCGSRENVGMTCKGWYYTVCEDCLRKMVEKSNIEYKWKCNDKIYIVNKDGKIEQPE